MQGVAITNRFWFAPDPDRYNHIVDQELKGLDVNLSWCQLPRSKERGL